MVEFSKKGNIYTFSRITGNRDHILGISFADKPSDDQTIEVVEWKFPNIDSSIIRTSKEEILQQVLAGLKRVNENLGTDYQLSKIYYVPSEDGSWSVYSGLLSYIIEHYHSGNQFKEIRGFYSDSEGSRQSYHINEFEEWKD